MSCPETFQAWWPDEVYIQDWGPNSLQAAGSAFSPIWEVADEDWLRVMSVYRLWYRGQGGAMIQLSSAKVVPVSLGGALGWEERDGWGS